MPIPFQGIHFNVIGEGEERLTAAGIRPLRMRGDTPATLAPDFNNAESAARYYLSQLVKSDERPTVRGLAAPSRPEVVPDMELLDSQRSDLTRSWTVRFVQTQASIPIFGSRAVVELDDNRELLSVDATVADVTGVSSVAAMSPAEALGRVATFAERDVSELRDVEAPELTYYHDEDMEEWHLSYLFENVPAAPPGYAETLRTHGVGRSPAARHPILHYLVDAHDGTILMHWSAVPTMEIPVACEGVDELGVRQEFYGRLSPNGSFELSDPLRSIRTFDFDFNDIDSAEPPSDAVHSSSAVFGDATAAVSAHFHAARVHDFCKSVLMRDGIDDLGMEIISFVNCTSPADQPPPDWHNAAWWNRRMWYGQESDGTGRFRSFARHLDIIAHELAHGITEFTANLMYVRQSGALNESFSDIFGVIIKNWDWSRSATGGDVTSWDWEIGPGLGTHGKPLRDFSDPARTGDPNHMNHYLRTTADNGGVHTNSNIHNKAAYNFLTAADAQGKTMFTPREVAVLYYLTLARLGRQASFRDALDTLVNVAGTFFAGDPRRSDKLAAIRDAYDAVGIQ